MNNISESEFVYHGIKGLNVFDDNGRIRCFYNGLEAYWVKTHRKRSPYDQTKGQITSETRFYQTIQGDTFIRNVEMLGGYLERKSSPWWHKLSDEQIAIHM